MTISISGGVQITHSNAKTSATTVPFSFSTTYFKASNTELSDIFGSCLDVDDDTLVVGAPQEDSNDTGINGNQSNNSASQRGAVYVFRLNKTTGVWTQEAYIKCPESTTNFGCSVAISGNTLAVTQAATQKVYIYTRSGTTWTYSQTLTPSLTPYASATGNVVALDGDLLVLGIPDEPSTTSGVGSTPNASGSARGAAIIFRRSGGTFAQEAYLKSSASSNSGYFGWSVDVSSSSNSVIVGEFARDPSSVNNAGAAEVFVYSGGSWSSQQVLTSSTLKSGAMFGYSVSIYGDLCVVGSPYDNSNATTINGDETNTSASNSGCAFAFKRTSGVWTKTHYIKSSNSEASDQFGANVKIYKNKILVSAHGEDGSGTGINPTSNNSSSGNGACFLFSYDGTNCTQTHYLKPTNAQSFQYFSGADYFTAPMVKNIALTDGIVAVGAYLDNSSTTGINSTKNTSASASGSVYAYNLW